MFDKTGVWIIQILNEIGAVAALTGETCYAIYKKQFHPKEILSQMVRIGVDSIPVALTTAVFVGMVFALQIANEFVKFGAGKLVGGVMAIAVARELAPVLTAVVLAARVGAAIAAEIGTMNVTQQIDALKTLGTNPVRYLIVPRFIASAVMLPILTLFADVVGFLGGFLVSVYVIQINSYSYIEAADTFLKTGDVFGGILKAFVFGMIIAMVASFRGLRAQNGAKGVGEATTSSVVTALMAIFVANYFLSTLLFK